MLAGATAVHFTSEEEKQLSTALTEGARAIVEPNGLDLGELADLPQAGSFRARCPEVADRRIILFQGRLHPVKGLEVLLEAFSAADLPESVLVIAGPSEGSYREKLERRFEAAVSAHRVLFVGMQHGRQRLETLVDAELFVLPSRQESFGVVAIEALATGTPVIVSDQVNIHREIRDAGLGWVVPLEAMALCETLRRASTDDDPSGPARLAGAGGLQWVTENYSWSVIAGRWREHYEDMISTGHEIASRSEHERTGR